MPFHCVRHVAQTTGRRRPDISVPGQTDATGCNKKPSVASTRSAGRSYTTAQVVICDIAPRA